MEQGEALAPELRVRYTPPRPSRQSTGLQVRWSCGGARRAVGNAWSAPGAKAIYAAVALMVVGAGVTAVGAYFLVKKKESPASPAAGVAVGVGGGAFVVGLWVLAIGCRDHVNQARTALRASDRQAPLALASYPQRPAPSRTPDQLFIQFP